VASAVIFTDCVKSISIFRGELYAISIATGLVRHSKDSKFIIFLDSLSILQALLGFRLELDLVQKVIKDYTQLVNSGKTTALCWIPSM